MTRAVLALDILALFALSACATLSFAPSGVEALAEVQKTPVRANSDDPPHDPPRPDIVPSRDASCPVPPCVKGVLVQVSDTDFVPVCLERWTPKAITPFSPFYPAQCLEV